MVWIFGSTGACSEMSQPVKWLHLSTGSLPISWGRMLYLSRSRSGDIDDGKMRMYGAIRSQNNENNGIPRLETSEALILCDTWTRSAEPCESSMKNNQQNCEFLPWRVARKVKWFAQTKMIPWWIWLRHFWLLSFFWRMWQCIFSWWKREKCGTY